MGHHRISAYLGEESQGRGKKVLEEYYTDALDKFLNDRENAEKLIAQGEYKRLETDPAKTAALMLTAQVIYNLDETITKE